MRYPVDYEEVWEDRYGETVLFRHVRGEDRRLFVEGLRDLSPVSIYHRFMGVKTAFSEAELTYLTEPSGEGHVGLVALKGFGEETRLVGVARAVRYLDHPDTMDFGLIVADCEQRAGIGRALMERIARAARERGARYLTGEMFATNTAMFHLVDTFLAPAEWLLAGSTATFRIDLAGLDGGGC